MSENKNITMDEIMGMSDTNIIMLALGSRNPGAFTVVNKLFEVIDNNNLKTDLVMKFINKLLIKDIVGERLWYIYKHEAKLDIDKLLDLTLDSYTNDYFYNKFEKYTNIL